MDHNGGKGAMMAAQGPQGGLRPQSDPGILMGPEAHNGSLRLKGGLGTTMWAQGPKGALRITRGPENHKGAWESQGGLGTT